MSVRQLKAELAVPAPGFSKISPSARASAACFEARDVDISHCRDRSELLVLLRLRL